MSCNGRAPLKPADHPTPNPHRLTLRGYGDKIVSMPTLPVSLRHLVLDGSDMGSKCLPPRSLRLDSLTRLQTLSLLGCAARS